MTLVISPLLALMRDQLLHLNRRFHIPATSINSDQTNEENAQAINAAKKGIIRILFISPEQLDDIDRFHFLSSLNISLLVIDEAHCISTWGHDFRPSYRQIIQFISFIEKNNAYIKILALTATADGKTERDIKQQLSSSLQKMCVHRAGMDRPNIQLCTIPASGIAHKLSLIGELLPQLQGCGLIYCATRENTELVTNWLLSRRINAAAYHAGLEAEVKRRIQDGLLKNKYSVIAATNALGMGIDKTNLRYIIHYDMPGSITSYYQEVGRCGRDGLPAHGILLFDPEDRKIQQYFIDAAQPTANDFKLVLNMIKNAHEAPNLMTIKLLSGLHPTLVTVIIAELIEQNYLVKSKENGKQVYYITGKNERPDLSRYLNQFQVKTNELNLMLNYGEGKVDCLMKNLRYHLGDLNAEVCTKCSICHRNDFQLINDKSLISSISQWLTTRVVNIEPFKTHSISQGIAILNGSLRSSIFIQFMKERIKPIENLYISEELFALIKTQLNILKKQHQLSCIIPIPSRTWLARNKLARILSEHLKIPVFLETLKWREYPVSRQGELLNNDQRRFNVNQKMTTSLITAIPQGTIILMDDYIGSGATIQEAARVLRKEAQFKNTIIPFTIAAIKWRLGKRGML
jgi:ATP-dependent DNA helicase RecQ